MIELDDDSRQVINFDPDEFKIVVKAHQEDTIPVSTLLILKKAPEDGA